MVRTRKKEKSGVFETEAVDAALIVLSVAQRIQTNCGQKKKKKRKQRMREGVEKERNRGGEAILSWTRP